MMLYDVLWCCMMLYDVIAVDFIPELCVFQPNAKLKPSYIPLCGIFNLEPRQLKRFLLRSSLHAARSWSLVSVSSVMSQDRLYDVHSSLKYENSS